MACGQKLSLAEIQALLRQTGFAENLIVKFSALALYESSGCAGIINDGSSTNSVEYSVGLWQINTRVHKNYTVQQLTNPVINAKEALRIYKSQGFNAWFNSNKKYNANYLGVRTQAENVYNQSKGINIISTVPNTNVLNNTVIKEPNGLQVIDLPKPDNNKNDQYFYIGLGILAILALRG